MAEVLKLSKPLKLIGANEDRSITELPYDFENMTARDKLNAGRKMKSDGYPIVMQELDMDYHLYLFAEAVRVADSTIDISDVLRISAKDAQEAEQLARNFFFFNLGDLYKMI